MCVNDGLPQANHVRRDRGGDGDRFACSRVREFDSLGVKCLAFDERLARVDAACNPPLRRTSPPAVLPIGDDGRSDVRQVNANLVRSARAWMNEHAGETTDAPGDFIKGLGRARAGTVMTHRHFFAEPRVGTDRGNNFVTIAVRRRRNDCQVLFSDGPPLKLLHELDVAQIGSRDDNDSAGIPVQPMNNSRTVRAADLAETSEMMNEGRRERALPVPLGRMNDHSRRFVDRDHIVVLPQDIERYFLADDATWFQLVERTQVYLDRMVGTEECRGTRRHTVDRGHVVSDQQLDARSARPGKLFREVPVESLAQIRMFRHERYGLNRSHLCGIRLFAGVFANYNRPRIDGIERVF